MMIFLEIMKNGGGINIDHRVGDWFVNIFCVHQKHWEGILGSTWFFSFVYFHILLWMGYELTNLKGMQGIQDWPFGSGHQDFFKCSYLINIYGNNWQELQEIMGFSPKYMAFSANTIGCHSAWDHQEFRLWVQRSQGRHDAGSVRAAVLK